MARRMKIRVVVSLALMAAMPIHAEDPLAEVIINESFLNQFAATQHSTAPTLEKNGWNTPNILTTVTPHLVTDPNSASFSMQMHAYGSVTAPTHVQQVTRRRQVVVSGGSTVNTTYNQMMHFSEDGLKPGAITGYPQATPYIQVSNNFRLLNGVVNRKATQMANRIIAQEMPGELARKDRETRAQISNAAEQAADFAGQAIQAAKDVLPKDLPTVMQPKFSSQGGPGGHIKMQVLPKGTMATQDRKPAPVLATAGQAATRSIVHQDLLNETLSMGLAGKEFKPTDLQKYLCGSKMAPMLDFCTQEVPDMPKLEPNQAIVFADKDPIKFEFKDGKMSVALNLAFRKLKPEGDYVSGPVVKPKRPYSQTEFESSPFSIEFAYKVDGTGAELEGPSIKERTRAVAGGNKNLLDLGIERLGLGRGNHADKGEPVEAEEEREFRAVSNQFVSAFIKKGLETGLKKALKPKIEFEPVSMPTKVSMADGREKIISETGTLAPLEIKMEDGWFAMTTGFCKGGAPSSGATASNPPSPSFGFEFSTVRYLSHNLPPEVRVEKTTPGSPAALNGFQYGDKIESFGIPGERATTTLGKVEELNKFLAEVAIEKNPAKRVVEIKGRDAQGNPFTRTITGSGSSSACGSKPVKGAVTAQLQ